MGIKGVVIIPLTIHGVMEYLDTLVSELRNIFGNTGLDLDILVWPSVIKPPMKCFDWSRLQYRAPCIARYLRDSASKLGIRDQLLLIGIGYLDGYDIGLNFVFGEAIIGENVAVVFTKRLRPEFYGEPSRFDLYFTRMLKEVVHELGHLLGLEHCNNYCVMRFSNSVYEVDEKPVSFCNECIGKLRHYMSRTK